MWVMLDEIPTEQVKYCCAPVLVGPARKKILRRLSLGHASHVHILWRDRS